MSAVIIAGTGQANITITGNTVNTDERLVDVTGPVTGLAVSGNAVFGGLAEIAAATSGVISGNTVVGKASTSGVTIYADGECLVAVRGNTFHNMAGSGVQLLTFATGGPEGVEISDNTIIRPNTSATTNTRAGIEVEDGQAFIHGNRIIPRTTAPLSQAAVRLDAGSFCCKVVGNDFGDPADYGTDAYIDNGTLNVNTWPADPTYGDNFTDCGS